MPGHVNPNIGENAVIHPYDIGSIPRCCWAMLQDKEPVNPLLGDYLMCEECEYGVIFTPEGWEGINKPVLDANSYA